MHQQYNSKIHLNIYYQTIDHEQYFRTDLPYYQPDVTEKTEQAIRWVTEHGYEPCFWSEGLLGSPL